MRASEAGVLLRTLFRERRDAGAQHSDQRPSEDNTGRRKSRPLRHPRESDAKSGIQRRVPTFAGMMALPCYASKQPELSAPDITPRRLAEIGRRDTAAGQQELLSAAVLLRQMGQLVEKAKFSTLCSGRSRSIRS